MKPQNRHVSPVTRWTTGDKSNRWKHAAKECREQELQRPNDSKGWQNKTKTLS